MARITEGECPIATKIFIEKESEKRGIPKSEMIRHYAEESGTPEATVQSWVYPRKRGVKIHPTEESEQIQEDSADHADQNSEKTCITPECNNPVFITNRGKPLGLKSKHYGLCNSCRNKRIRGKRDAEATDENPNTEAEWTDGEPTWTCTECGVELPVSKDGCDCEKKTTNRKRAPNMKYEFAPTSDYYRAELPLKEWLLNKKKEGWEKGEQRVVKESIVALTTII